MSVDRVTKRRTWRSRLLAACAGICLLSLTVQAQQANPNAPVIVQPGDGCRRGGRLRPLMELVRGLGGRAERGHEHDRRLSRHTRQGQDEGQDEQRHVEHRHVTVAVDEISAKEAPILRRIFQTWFNGQI